LDLALRLIHHEARTYTIRQWTGLTDDRIRKLYREYAARSGRRTVRRHRGKSPRQAAYFFRYSEVSFQATQLASLYLMFGLLAGSASGVDSRYKVGSLESGALLCHAYETYLELHAPAMISFEHAWFLLLALARGDELGLARCTACAGLRIMDLLSRRKLACSNCTETPTTLMEAP
jgi:hypothetical protein